MWHSDLRRVLWSKCLHQIAKLAIILPSRSPSPSFCDLFHITANPSNFPLTQGLLHSTSPEVTDARGTSKEFTSRILFVNHFPALYESQYKSALLFDNTAVKFKSWTFPCRIMQMLGMRMKFLFSLSYSGSMCLSCNKSHLHNQTSG